MIGQAVAKRLKQNRLQGWKSMYTAPTTRNPRLWQPTSHGKIGCRDRGVKEAEFYVLKHTKASAWLLEIGFLNNSKDNQLFHTKFEAILETAGIAQKPKTCPTCGQKTS